MSGPVWSRPRPTHDGTAVANMNKHYPFHASAKAPLFPIHRLEDSPMLAVQNSDLDRERSNRYD